jgi:phosphoribosylamine---glycine ligase
MKILLVGGGGREHALAWALARTTGVTRVAVAPGNAGTAREPGVLNVDLADRDQDGLLSYATSMGADLTVVGPEAPLAAGLTDRLRAAGLAVFGPSQAAARLEASKGWSRDFMARHGVSHPRYTVVTTVAEAGRAIDALGGACVVKADGLAAGKGVAVCDTAEAAREAAQAMLVRSIFGAAGARVVVEERLSGPELSVMAVTDGSGYVLLPPAQDHKRLLAGDQGPNTGGMGAYAPAPIGTAALMDDVAQRIVAPVLAGMAAEGVPFSGCLYCGLMLTERGPVVIEFNARFGDPETQVQLPLLTGDLAELLHAAATGGLAGRAEVAPARGHACCVVLAAPGYPGQVTTGLAVAGLDRAAAQPGVTVFHAGTRAQGDDVVTSGGRALNVVCVRDSLTEAVAGAYDAIGPAGVHFEGMQYRTDIAHRAL